MEDAANVGFLGLEDSLKPTYFT
ncbi:uncharacterized protein METZ01_LOCUS351393, partial [marine metagenome]